MSRSTPRGGWCALVIVTVCLGSPDAARWDGAQDRSASFGPGALSSRAAVLADSEVRYLASGGVAGFITAATLKAGDGILTAEFRAPQSRVSAAPMAGTPTEAEYLELWRRLEEGGAWRLRSDVPARSGADMVRHELHLRIGERSRAILWYDESASPDARSAAALADHVLKSADQAARLR